MLVLSFLYWMVLLTQVFMWFGVYFGSYRPLEVPGLKNLLGLVAEGCPGHGLVHLLVDSARVIGFVWDANASGWIRTGLPLLHHLNVRLDLRKRQGFRVVRY